MQDLPAQVCESGAKTAEIDYRNSPLEAARGQRVGVVVGASSGRHGKGRFVIATGVLESRSRYMVSRDEWQASARSGATVALDEDARLLIQRLLVQQRGPVTTRAHNTAFGWRRNIVVHESDVDGQSELR